jgi:hypothetical protein
MSLVKAKRKENMILDFSDSKISKNKIRKSLRLLRIKNVYCNKNNLTIYDNFVKVGTYNIKLVLHENYDNKPKRLRDFGRFQIRLFDQNKEIILNKDYRFKKQTWIKSNTHHSLTIRNLIDTIIYCNKLYKLKIFL